MLYVKAEGKYSLFNGLPLKVMNYHRDDGLIEVFIPAIEIYILLKESEIERDDWSATIISSDFTMKIFTYAV